MKQNFIPHTEALVLKELGFKEPCFGWYNANINYDLQFYDLRGGTGGCMNTIGESASAPLYQQAFSFFRESYDLCGWIYTSDNKKYHYTILSDGRIIKANGEEDSYKTAEHACLLKLIEIVKK